MGIEMEEKEIQLVDLTSKIYTGIALFVEDFDLSDEFEEIYGMSVNEYLALDRPVSKITVRDIAKEISKYLVKAIPARQGYYINCDFEDDYTFEIILYTALHFRTTDKPLVGWQLVDSNNDMPSDMWSFCIYDLTYCILRQKEDLERWKFLPIYEDTIEEPTHIRIADALID